MIVDNTESEPATKHARCASCGRKAERLVNCPGNILAPACRHELCGFAHTPGIIECEGFEFPQTAPELPS